MAVEMFRRQVNGTVSKPGPSTVWPDEHLFKYLEVANCGFGRLYSQWRQPLQKWRYLVIPIHCTLREAYRNVAGDCIDFATAISTIPLCFPCSSHNYYQSRSIVDTKESVDEMLQFLAGKPVLVKDLFRLGKYVPSADPQNSSHRPRPVLIKLTTPWDRRLILLRKSNLRNYAIPRLFVREDVAPEHKLRQRKPKEVTSSPTIW